MLKVMFLEDQYHYNPYRYRCICQVKYRAEEDIVLPTPKRYPVGEYARYEREIKHIHHAAMKQRRIMIHHPVKGRVDNIAHRAGKYQRHVHYQTTVVFMLYQINQSVA